MKNWKIGARLALGFGLLLVFMVAIVVLSITRLSAMADDLDEGANRRVKVVKLANDMIDAINLGALGARDVILYTDPAGIAKSKSFYEQTLKNYNTAIDELNKIVTSEGSKTQLVALKKMGDDLEVIEKEAVALAAQNQNEQATAMLHTKVGPGQDELRDAISKFIKYQEDRGRQAFEKALFALSVGGLV